MSFLIIEKITENIPVISRDIVDFKIPNNITLADPTFNISKTVDILIGAGTFWEIMCPDQFRTKQGLVMQQTQLGWVISGALLPHVNRICGSACNLAITNETLYNQIERFWKTEECVVKTTFTRQKNKNVKCIL